MKKLKKYIYIIALALFSLQSCKNSEVVISNEKKIRLKINKECKVEIHEDLDMYDIHYKCPDSSLFVISKIGCLTSVYYKYFNNNEVFLVMSKIKNDVKGKINNKYWRVIGINEDVCIGYFNMSKEKKQIYDEQFDKIIKDINSN